MEKISHKARIPGATRSWKIQEAPPAEAPKGMKTCLHLDFELPAASLQGEAPLPTPGSVAPGNAEAGGPWRPPRGCPARGPQGQLPEPRARSGVGLSLLPWTAGLQC